MNNTRQKSDLERWKGWLIRLGGGCRRRSNWKGRLQHNKALILPHTSLLFFEAKSCKIQYALAESLRKPPTARRAAKPEFLPAWKTHGRGVEVQHAHAAHGKTYRQWLRLNAGDSV